MASSPVSGLSGVGGLIGYFVCCSLCWWSEGLFSPFDLLLYSGFVITTADEVFLQLCSSLVKRRIRRADAPHPESLAVGDSLFTVSWVAAVGSKVLVGVSWFHIQVGHCLSINYLYICVQE